MMERGFSIVICCYNSTLRLPETLSYIAALKLPHKVPCELIIVNNASTDNTVETAQKEWKKYTTAISFKMTDELQPGLSKARRKGFDIARYEYVLMCDDDNWLADDYLINALTVFERHSNIGVLGGIGTFICEIKPPEWLQHTRLFATGPQASKPGRVQRKKVYGAGAIVRNSAYKKLQAAGFESLLTDRVGTNLSSGGDYEICLAIYIAGYDIWYDDSLKFQHYFPKERLSRSYYLTYISQSVQCLTVIDAYVVNLYKNINPNKLFITKYLLKEISYCTKERLRFKMFAIKHPEDSPRGIFIRFRIHFFTCRIKEIINNFFNVYNYSNKVKELKARLYPKTISKPVIAITKPVKA